MKYVAQGHSSSYVLLHTKHPWKAVAANNSLLLSHIFLWFDWTQWGGSHMWLLSGRSQGWNHLEVSLLTLSVPHLEYLGAGQASLSACGVSAWLHCSYQHGGLSIIRPLTQWLASRRLEQVFQETSGTCQFIKCWAQKPAQYCSYFFSAGENSQRDHPGRIWNPAQSIEMEAAQLVSEHLGLEVRSA